LPKSTDTDEVNAQISGLGSDPFANDTYLHQEEVYSEPTGQLRQGAT
jgi:hypothetical protein